MENYKSFSFGRNWQKYLKSLTKENIIYARKSLRHFLGDVANKTFLDIGSGSGIFSYAMYTLGSKQITSIDIDPFCVQCAKFLKNKLKNPQIWKIYQGSILDKKFISKLGKFDIIYAWGVLHHTGKLWNAIINAASLVNNNGLFYLAIYNKTKKSKYRFKIKKIYNLSPKLGKIMMNYLFFCIGFFISPLIRFKNPFKILKNYHKVRGMNPFIEVRDYLGGLPYEYASFDEILNFINNLNLNFKLIKYIKAKKEENNEFLFKKIV